MEVDMLRRQGSHALIISGAIFLGIILILASHSLGNASSPKHWKMKIMLEAPNLAAQELQFVILDEDPIPLVINEIEKSGNLIKRRSSETTDSVLPIIFIYAQITAIWNSIIANEVEEKGNRSFLLKAGSPQWIAANTPPGKKWIVTKVVTFKDELYPICWSVPIETTIDSTVKVSLSELNYIRLDELYYKTLKRLSQ